MNLNKNHYALVASYDKEKAFKVIQYLLNKDFIVYATDGTYKKYKDTFKTNINNKLRPVSEITGFSDFFNGRVKTLNHKIFCSILASTEEDFNLLKNMNLPFFSVVFVDLYPFDKIKEQLNSSKSNGHNENMIELIDIGGVALIRAAAKNYQHVSVIVDITDLENAVEKITDLSFKEYLMKKAFLKTALYEQHICSYFNHDIEFLSLQKVDIQLRYGENYHQTAIPYKIINSQSNTNSIFDFPVTSNKAMSYNNYVDLDALIKLLYDLRDFNTCAIIKHNNPCGVAVSKDNQSTKNIYLKALSSDPVSAFGGVIGFTRTVDYETAKELENAFIDVIAAPNFDESAFELIKKKKNRRIIKIHDFDKLIQNQIYEYKYVINGFLKQSYDFLTENFEDFELVCGKPIPKERITDAILSWAVCKNTKSNAIVITKDCQTIGIGSGQTSRIDAAKIAIEKAKFFKFDLEDAICSSDAFLPFEDTVELMAQNNVNVIIQPGGSINDDKIIQKAKELGVTMYFSKIRHFKH